MVLEAENYRAGAARVVRAGENRHTEKLPANREVRLVGPSVKQ